MGKALSQCKKTSLPPMLPCRLTFTAAVYIMEEVGYIDRKG